MFQIQIKIQLWPRHLTLHEETFTQRLKLWLAFGFLHHAVRVLFDPEFQKKVGRKQKDKLGSKHYYMCKYPKDEHPFETPLQKHTDISEELSNFVSILLAVF